MKKKPKKEVKQVVHHHAMNELKKKIMKDWGKQCKTFSPLCAVCLIWRAFETIDELYSEKSHLTDWSKLK